MSHNARALILLIFLSISTNAHATENLAHFFKNKKANVQLNLEDFNYVYTRKTPNFLLGDVVITFKKKVTYKIIRKYAFKLLSKFIRPYLREDYRQFLSSSVHPHKAQEEYQGSSSVGTLGYRPYSWLNGKTLYTTGPLDITEELLLRSRIDLTKFNPRNPNIFSFGILRTKVRFKLKLDSKNLVKSFTIRMEKTFRLFYYFCRAKFSYRHRFEENTSNLEFQLVIT